MSVSQQIRVLQVVPSLGRSSGVANFVYNMEYFHDEKRVHYDFLHHAISSGKHFHQERYDSELEEHGSTVYTVNYAGDGLLRFNHEIHDFFSKNGMNYDIVHCHMPNTAFAVLKEAKRCGIANRVLHSHLNKSSDIFFHSIRNIPLNFLGKRYSTDNLACSQDAGQFLFKKKPFTVIHNGILIDKYIYNSVERSKKRLELGIGENDIVIGCVGRFVKQKNLGFAISLFSRFHRLYPHSKLLLLGDGEGRSELENLISEEEIVSEVFLPGVRSDINQMYSVMDVFLMPSLCEGLPVSAIEAQAAGLPCLYSDNVPKETDITGTGAFLPLTASINQWIRGLEQCIGHGRSNSNAMLLEEKGYSAKGSAELLMQHYEQIVNQSINGRKYV